MLVPCCCCAGVTFEHRVRPGVPLECWWDHEEVEPLAVRMYQVQFVDFPAVLGGRVRGLVPFSAICDGVLAAAVMPLRWWELSVSRISALQHQWVKVLAAAYNPH